MPRRDAAVPDASMRQHEAAANAPVHASHAAVEVGVPVQRCVRARCGEASAKGRQVLRSLSTPEEVGALAVLHDGAACDGRAHRSFI